MVSELCVVMRRTYKGVTKRLQKDYLAILKNVHATL